MNINLIMDVKKIADKIADKILYNLLRNCDDWWLEKFLQDKKAINKFIKLSLDENFCSLPFYQKEKEEEK